MIQFCTQVMGLPAPATSRPITTLAPLPPPGPELPSGRILVGQDGQYLGTVSCSEYASEGIFSRYGAYGGQYSSTSIWNKYGTYGGRYGTYSAFSKYGGSPPEIIESGSFVTYLTVGYNAPLVLPHSCLRTKLRGPGVSLCRWAVQALVTGPAAKDLGADSRRRWPSARAPALLALAHHGTAATSEEHSAGARVSLLAVLQRRGRRGRALYSLQETPERKLCS